MSDQPDLEALATGAHALAVRNGLIQSDSLARAVLAAVLPAHERMVREKVAAEIEAAQVYRPNTHDEFFDGGLQTAARIARGQG